MCWFQMVLSEADFLNAWIPTKQRFRPVRLLPVRRVGHHVTCSSTTIEELPELLSTERLHRHYGKSTVFLSFKTFWSASITVLFGATSEAAFLHSEPSVPMRGNIVPHHPRVLFAVGLRRESHPVYLDPCRLDHLLPPAGESRWRIKELKSRESK